MGYDINKRPSNDSATKMYSSFARQKLLKVNERDNSFDIDVKESHMWADNRIKMSMKENNSYLKLAPDVNLPAILMPISDTVNLKKLTMNTDPFKFTELRFLHDQQISTTSTVINITIDYTVTLYCDFKFRRFPFDTQKCKYHMRSLDPDEFQMFLYDPTYQTLYSTKHYKAHGFDVTISFHNESNEIEFDIELTRIVLPYILQYYLPCCCIVMVSFISFIVPLSALPGRVGLMVTQFLTLTNIFIHQMVSIDDLKAR